MAGEFGQIAQNLKPNINFTWTPQMTFWLVIALWLLIVLVFFIWVIRKYIIFDRVAYILEKIQGQGTVLQPDRARFKFNKDGQVYFGFYKNKKLKPTNPDSDLFVHQRGMFSRKGAIFFAKLNEIEVVPLAIHDTWNNSPFHLPAKFDIEKWNSAIQDQILIKIKNQKPQQLLQVAMVIGFILILVMGSVMLYFNYKGNKEIANSNSALVASNQQIAKILTTQTQVWANACNIPLPSEEKPPT